jgi:hypothetical protein
VTGLESAQLKIQRARVHFNALESAAWKYAEAQAKLIPDSQGEPTLNLGAEPSTDISILAGEIVYQLRSALDHLTFELVKSSVSNIILPKDWSKRCEFPLLLKVPTFGNPAVAHPVPVPYAVFENFAPWYFRRGVYLHREFAAL